MPDPRQGEFMRLLSAHTGIIHKVIRLYVDHETDREDMYQEVVLQAWRSFGHFQGKSSFSTWLYKVALNTALTWFRKRPSQDIREVRPEDQVTSPSEDWELREVLHWAIRRLPEADRMLILLHLEGYKNPEIADIAGMTTNHVNVKLHRIRQQLETTLKAQGHGS